MREIKQFDPIEVTPFVDDRLVISVQPRLIDSLLAETRETPSGESYTFVPNDITLLVEQQKLMHFNPRDVQAVIDSFARSSTGMSDALKGLSDEQILSTVKSRYIQSAADMRSYAESLSRQVRDVLTEIQQKALESQEVVNNQREHPFSSAVESESK